jgi:hypothetical protein
MRDCPTIHLDKNESKGTTCCKKGIDVNEQEKLPKNTIRHKIK